MEQGSELSIARLDESGVPMKEGPPFAGGWGYTRETACQEALWLDAGARPSAS